MEEVKLTGRRWVDKGGVKKVTFKRRCQRFSIFFQWLGRKFVEGMLLNLTVKEEYVPNLVQVFEGSDEWETAPYIELAGMNPNSFEIKKRDEREFDA